MALNYKEGENVATSNTFYGYVYKTTNTLNGRIYIGQHKNPIHNLKYLGSGKLIKYAISKYGKENFTNEVVCWCENVEEMDEKETFYIEIYSRFFDIYNIAKGGEGGDLLKYASPEKRRESIDKMIATRKRLGIGVGESNPMYGSGKNGTHPLIGVKMPQERKDRISNTLMGNIPWNKGTRKIKTEEEIRKERLDRYLANKHVTPIKVTNLEDGIVMGFLSKKACEDYFECSVKYRLKVKKLEDENKTFERITKEEYIAMEGVDAIMARPKGSSSFKKR